MRTLEARLDELESATGMQDGGPVVLLLDEGDPLPDPLPRGSILFLRERVVTQADQDTGKDGS